MNIIKRKINDFYNIRQKYIIISGYIATFLLYSFYEDGVFCESK